MPARAYHHSVTPPVHPLLPVTTPSPKASAQRIVTFPVKVARSHAAPLAHGWHCARHAVDTLLSTVKCGPLFAVVPSELVPLADTIVPLMDTGLLQSLDLDIRSVWTAGRHGVVPPLATFQYLCPAENCTPAHVPIARSSSSGSRRAIVALKRTQARQTIGRVRETGGRSVCSVDHHGSLRDETMRCSNGAALSARPWGTQVGRGRNGCVVSAHTAPVHARIADPADPTKR